jgi:hypothetical protein
VSPVTSTLGAARTGSRASNLQPELFGMDAYPWRLRDRLALSLSANLDLAKTVGLPCTAQA